MIPDDVGIDVNDAPVNPRVCRIGRERSRLLKDVGDFRSGGLDADNEPEKILETL